MTQKRAFTLVELLVVIGIIVLLIAILMPALSRARKQALQASCGSNARQVTYGALAYGNDWKEQLPTRLGTLGTLWGWQVEGLSMTVRLPIIGFDTRTIWDWGTYWANWPGSGCFLGGWAFVMRDYLKNDFDVYVCPDGFYTRNNFLGKVREVACGTYNCPFECDAGGDCFETVRGGYAGLGSYHSGYLWLPHRPASPYTNTAGNCGGPVNTTDVPGDIPKTASDLPGLLVMADFNIFSDYSFAGCGKSPDSTACGVGGNHNASSYRQLPIFENACAPRIFPPNIGRQENPMEMPLGMNESRIDARTTWTAWQDWRYYRYAIYSGANPIWHAF